MLKSKDIPDKRGGDGGVKGDAHATVSLFSSGDGRVCFYPPLAQVNGVNIHHPLVLLWDAMAFQPSNMF